MTFQRIFLAIGVLLCAAFGWRYRHLDVFSGLSGAESNAAVSIQFDNGTVRDMGSASDAKAAAAEAPRPPGGLRKCVGRDRTTYTEMSCPPGSKEQAIGGKGTFTVVPGLAPPQPVAAAGALLPQRKSVRDVWAPETGAALNAKRVEGPVGE